MVSKRQPRISLGHQALNARDLKRSLAEQLGFIGPQLRTHPSACDRWVGPERSLAVVERWLGPCPSDVRQPMLRAIQRERLTARQLARAIIEAALRDQLRAMRRISSRYHAGLSFGHTLH